MNVENRIYKSDNVELRAFKEDNKMFVEGYASKFNVESRLLAENGRVFNEVILPNAFRDVLNDDVYYSFNHSKDNVFARTTNNTLILSEDEVGLKFRAELNDTNGAVDLYKMIERGDVFENSFAFMVDKDGQKWERSSDGNNIRKISRISRLIDLSTVTHAAYPETEVSVVRGLNEYLEEPKPIKINYEPDKMRVQYLKTKNKIN